MNAQLDQRVDRIVDAFTNEIQTLNNSECEYLLRQLIERLDGWLERLAEAARAEQ